MQKVEQVYIDKFHREENIFSMMGFSGAQTFIKISFLTEPCKFEIENGIIYLDNYYYITLKNNEVEEKINIGQTGILELENIELTGIYLSSNIPYLNIMYSYNN